MRTGSNIDEALQEARLTEHLRQESGFDQVALDAAAKAGLNNGIFEECDDDAESVTEEFFSPTDENTFLPERGAPVSVATTDVSTGLNGKLALKAERLETHP